MNPNDSPEQPSRGSSHRRPRGPRGSRGRGGGGRGRGASGKQRADNGERATSLHASSRGLEPQPAATSLQRSETLETDGEICFICASPVIHFAIAGPCNHRTCHVCSLRLRALYKTKACAHCRTESDFAIFTDGEQSFEEFSDNALAHSDASLGIKYLTTQIRDDTLLLLRYNCPDPDCDIACLGWPDLHRHVRAAHKKFMCDLCTRNKKVFTHEHELFTQAELRKHERDGDDKPGTADQTGFRGHPECGFCRIRFYGDDELFQHCRDRHEKCHVCDRINEGRSPQYFLNYDTLEKHFREKHFICTYQDCLDKKFVVFASEIDLQAHQLEEHSSGLSKDARKINLANFNVREPYHPGEASRRGRGSGRGRGRRGPSRSRSRERNRDAGVSTTPQPLRRDEQALQRQAMTTNEPDARPFGAQLSAPTPAVRQPNAFPTLSEVARNLPQADANTPATSQQAGPREEKHQAVISRASVMLRNDGTKVAEFRSRISAFKNSNITAGQLIGSFHSLFDSSPTELGTLIKELAELFELPVKRDDLLKAWNDWRAVNEDYPSLPGSSQNPTNSTTSASSHGGARVLAIKNSTAPNRGSTWLAAASSPSSARTSNTSGGGSSGRAYPKAQTKASTPWMSKAPATASGAAAATTPAGPVPSSSSPASSSTAPRRLADAEAFPALPQTQKPTLPFWPAGYTGSGVRRTGGLSGVAPPKNIWERGDEGVDGVASAPEEPEEGGKKKKGRAAKKEILFKFG